MTVTPTFAIWTDSPGAGYNNKETGWPLYDAMKESIWRPDYLWPSLYDLLAEERPPYANLPSVFFIKEINALICQPYECREDAIPINEWGYFGSDTDVWEERSNPVGDMPGTWYLQPQSDLDTENGMWTLNNLPPNPSFMIPIRRHHLKSDWNFANGEGYTSIMWGGGRFQLVIPYSGAAVLYDADNNYCMTLPSAGGNLGGSGGQEGMQSFNVHIMHLGGKVLISFDGMHSFTVYSKGDKAENEITVPAAPVQVSNWGASWLFRLVAIDYLGAGQFTSKEFDKGYVPTSALEGGGTDGAWGDWAWNYWLYADGSGDIPAIGIADISAGGQYCQYQATLTPVSYAVGSTTFGHTPELFAVRLQNKPVCETVIGINPPSISASDVLGMEIELAEDVDTARAVVTLNNIGGTYQNLMEYTPIAISLGTVEGGYTTLFSGFCYYPRPTEDSKGHRILEMECRSAALPFCEVGCTEAEPEFSGRLISEALEWASLRCGVSFSKATYETGTYIPSGKLGERSFQPAPGRSWMDFLKQLCELEQYYLRFSGFSLQYRDYPTYETIDWHFKDAENTSGAPSNAMKIINWLECPRDPSNHRNEIIAMGQDVDGGVIAAKYQDTSNINSVGWRKTTLVADPAWDTQERVNLVARKLAVRLIPFPPRTVSFRIEGNQAVMPRDIIKLWGGVSGYGGQIFRVTRVCHRWNRATGKSWVTEITAKWGSAG
jgi:hypothetical protein